METTLSHPTNTLKDKGLTNPVDSIHPSREKSLVPKKSILFASNDIAKVNQLRSSLETSSFSNEAEFTKDTLLFFQHMGIDANKVDPVPLGIGANHAVYKYETPEGAQKVIKLTRPGGTLSTMNRGISEGENIKEVQKYFGPYFPETEFKEDQSTKIACQVQDVVEGEPISDKNYTPGIKKQLQEIALMNKKAIKEKNISLDFVGMSGSLKWIKKQFRKLVFKEGEAKIANILVDKQGRLKIIDTDFYRFNDARQSFTDHIFSKVSHFFTQVFIKHYFDINV